MQGWVPEQEKGKDGWVDRIDCDSKDLPGSLIERFPYISHPPDELCKAGESFAVSGVRVGKEYEGGYTTNCEQGRETRFINNNVADV